MHYLIEQFKQLRWPGMIEAFEMQLKSDEYKKLTFEERLSMLVEHEATLRENKRLKRRLTEAKLKQKASLDKVDFSYDRGLDRRLILSLESCDWICQSRNILILGPTGTGKSYLGEALTHKACLMGHTARFERVSRFFLELEMAKNDGSYLQKIDRLAKIDLLVLDDFGVTTLSEEASRNFLEIIEERQHTKSTLITSQLPTNHWHSAISNSTLADAILDRLVHQAYKIELKGESIRKIQGEQQHSDKNLPEKEKKQKAEVIVKKDQEE